ncbi:MAG: GerMN domain-containing protein [Clostridia bacterium]|nr:GerMN domain-containing protein [Clostridia bacterium]
MKRNRLICIFIAIMLLLASCGNKEKDDSYIEIDPYEESITKNDKTALLYYATSDYRYLVAYEAEIEVPVSTRMEFSVISMLKSTSHEGIRGLNQLINPNTELISVSDGSSYVSILLSNDFLNWSFIPQTGMSVEELDAIKRMAVYSIVNSLIDSTGCPKVQILVDVNGNRRGQRISLQSVGFAEEGILGPLSRQSGVILTGEKTVTDIFTLLESENYAELYQYIASKDKDGEARPPESNFINRMQSEGITLESFRIRGTVESSSSSRKLIMVDYAFNKESGRKEQSNIPVELIKDNGVWKISYETLLSLF